VELWGWAGPRGGRVRSDGVGRQRLGWPTGAPFSEGTDVEGLAVNPGPGGAVEDWGGGLWMMWMVAER
jgi:hypothetical protein